MHDGSRSLDVTVRVEMLPMQRKTCGTGELLEEGALGAAVAFAEGMNSIYLTEVVG